jgi:predicted  nucleic acid-binding Zn-ribbon protein
VDAAHLLYELQELDLRIAADGARLNAEQAKIQEPPAVRQARAAIQAAEQQIAGLQKELRSTEQEVESVSSKKTAVHNKLYGGAVTVPRELAALETEEAALAKTLAQLEDRELELMAAAEDAEKALAAANASLQQALDTWRAEGQEAHQHIDALQAELDKLRTERAELAGQVSPALLATYERLRPRKGGRAVALVQDNRCLACRVSLPSGDVQRARGADPPHTCENCGRLLYVP